MTDTTPANEDTVWATLCAHCWENRQEAHSVDRCADVWDATYWEGQVQTPLTGFCICPQCRVAISGTVSEDKAAAATAPQSAMPPAGLGPSRVRF